MLDFRSFGFFSLQILKEVYVNASNRNCADCNAEGWWSAANFCFLTSLFALISINFMAEISMYN